MENARRRAIITDMLNTFGVRVMRHDNDLDDAVNCLAAGISSIAKVDRDVAIELLAYTVRRLWFKRAEAVRSLN